MKNNTLNLMGKILIILVILISFVLLYFAKPLLFPDGDIIDSLIISKNILIFSILNYFFFIGLYMCYLSNK